MNMFWQEFLPSITLGLLTFFVLRLALAHARARWKNKFSGYGYDWTLFFIATFAASLPTTYLK